MINAIMEKRAITKYKLSKNSQIPYSTISDICSGKTELTKCSAETVYKLSKELNVTMEDLLSPYMEHRCSFDLFKSNICHRVKSLSDIDFLIEILEKDEIRMYYDRKWYAECLYLLAMVDYLSRLNNIPLCTQYEDLRRLKLQVPLFPSSVLATAAVSKNSSKVKALAIQEAIPEFIRFNIVESEVWNVV